MILDENFLVLSMTHKSWVVVVVLGFYVPPTANISRGCSIEAHHLLGVS